MRRALALGLALVALIAAGFLWTRDRPVAQALPPPPPAPAAEVEPEPEAAEAPTPLIAPRRELSPAEREARRFGRYDKDRDDRISRDEFLSLRRKAFAKLDSNGDGELGFDEYAVKSRDKFAAADANHDGVLVAGEFVTTARKAKPKAPCVCDKE